MDQNNEDIEAFEDIHFKLLTFCCFICRKLANKADLASHQYLFNPSYDIFDKMSDLDFTEYPVSSYDVTATEYLASHPGSNSSYPYMCACANVFNSEGKVLLVQRAATQSYPKTWQVPGGKYNYADRRETIAGNASRELHEEAGIVAQPVDVVGSLCFVSSKGKPSQEVHFIMEVRGTPTVVLNSEIQSYA